MAIGKQRKVEHWVQCLLEGHQKRHREKLYQPDNAYITSENLKVYRISEDDAILVRKWGYPEYRVECCRLGESVR